MEWVRQSGAPGRNGGCGIACLGMLLDLDYNAVREIAPELCEKCGVEQEVMDAVLSARGFAVMRVTQYQPFDDTTLPKWPPKPFAPRHLVLVTQTRKDHVAHWVTTDARGRVYDPADDEYTPSRLSRYYRVESVAGVFPVP